MNILNDFKNVQKELKQYKNKNKTSFFSPIKVLTIIYQAIKKMAVLFLVLVLMILALILLDAINLFGTSLYYSFFVCYVYVVYLIITFVFLFKRLIYQEYKKQIRVHCEAFLRLLYTYTIIVGLILVLVYSYLQMTFIKKYVNPPLYYCSYYDIYGNDLFPYEYRNNDNMCNDVLIETTFDDTNQLSKIVLRTKDIDFEYNYQAKLIVRRAYYLNSSYLYNYYPELTALNLSKIKIDVRYEYGDVMKETRTLYGYVSSKVEPAYELIKEEYTYQLTNDRIEVEVVRSNFDNNIDYIPLYLFKSNNYYLDKFDQSINGYTHEFDAEKVTVYNYAFLGDYETFDEFYLYEELSDDLYVLKQNSKLKVFRDIKNEKKLQYDKDNAYSYKTIINGDKISRIDQYKNNLLHYRHLFENEEYGYKVFTYSYLRGGIFAFADITKKDNPYILSINNIFRKNPLDDYYDGSHTSLFYQREPLVQFLRMKNWSVEE